MSNPEIISNDEKSWLISKIQSFYKRELYFQSVDLQYYMSSLKYALYKTSSVDDLSTELQNLDLGKGFKFVRKGNKKKDYKYFEYPDLAFQVKCLLRCWPEIIKIQKNSGEDISKAMIYQKELQFLEEHEDDEPKTSALDTGRTSFGNKPNLNITLNCSQNITLQENEERKSFPLGVDFKFEYNSFRKTIIRVCENVTGKKIGKHTNRDVVFIQTDLKNFFHNLEIVPLIHFLKKEYPNAANLISCLEEASNKYKWDSLPIGWILSRFISNIVILHFHEQLKLHLERNLKSSLTKEIEYGANRLLQAPKEFDVRIEESISFVDDFVFLLSLPSDEISLDSTALAKKLIYEAQGLINKVIPGNRTIEFYSTDESKTKVYRLDVDSITVLKSNFAFFKTADEYFLDDPDIRARVDEVLLPSDNDLTFNQNEQFRRNLMNLQKFVISEQNLSDKAIDDLLSQIKLKVEKTGAKYIRTVFGLLRLIIVSDNEGKISKEIRERHIPELFRKCKKSHNYSSDWIKFFSGYFNLLRSIDFAEADRDQYFKLLGEATNLMKSRGEDDQTLLQIIRNDSVYKLMCETGLISSKSKAAKPNTKSTEATLNEIMNQKYLMVQYLGKLFGSTKIDDIQFNNKSIFWIGNVVSQSRIKSANFKDEDFKALLNILKKSISNLTLLEYGIPRLISAILPNSDDKAGIELIENAMKILPAQSDLEFLHRAFSKRADLKKFFSQNEAIRCQIAFQQFFLDDKNSDHMSNFIFDLLSAARKNEMTSLELLASYFISLRLNTESDFYRYIHSICHSPDSNQITSWTSLPLTFQRVGILISTILKEIFAMPAVSTEDVISTNLMPKIQNLLEEFKNELSNRKSLENKDGTIRAPTSIDLDKLFSLFDREDKKLRPFKVTVAPISMNVKSDLSFKNGFQYTTKARRIVDIKIRNAIDEAIKQKASFLVFPEISLPRIYLQSYLRLLAGHDIILVGGLEYATDLKKNAFNSTIISVPVLRSTNPGGRGYMVFEQIKNFPSAEESYYLNKAGFKYSYGDTLYIFKSSVWGDFAVLTCSDFLSLGFRWLLQGEVQSVFVPAQNRDSVTYDHISESCIRDLHCMAIVCNNPLEGSSHCYAPFYDKVKREKFKRVGKSDPECHTFEIDPRVFKHNQSSAKATEPFRDPDDKNNKRWGEFIEFKQLPPDWEHW